LPASCIFRPHRTESRIRQRRDRPDGPLPKTCRSLRSERSETALEERESEREPSKPLSFSDSWIAFSPALSDRRRTSIGRSWIDSPSSNFDDEVLEHARLDVIADTVHVALDVG
jgi:hypothetical protein